MFTASELLSLNWRTKKRPTVSCLCWGGGGGGGGGGGELRGPEDAEARAVFVFVVQPSTREPNKIHPIQWKINQQFKCDNEPDLQIPLSSPIFSRIKTKMLLKIEIKVMAKKSIRDTTALMSRTKEHRFPFDFQFGYRDALYQISNTLGCLLEQLWHNLKSWKEKLLRRSKKQVMILVPPREQYFHKSNVAFIMKIHLTKH